LKIFILHPFSIFKINRKGNTGEKYKDYDDPKAVGIILQGKSIKAHSENIDYQRHRRQNYRNRGQQFHCFVQLIGKQSLVGFFYRLDHLFMVFDRVPYLDIRSDDFLGVAIEIFHIFFAKKMESFVGQRFQYRMLRLDDPPEIDDIAFDDGDFPEHFLFLALENIFFDFGNIFGDMVQHRHLGVYQGIQ